LASALSADALGKSHNARLTRCCLPVVSFAPLDPSLGLVAFVIFVTFDNVNSFRLPSHFSRHFDRRTKRAASTGGMPGMFSQEILQSSVGFEVNPGSSRPSSTNPAAKKAPKISCSGR